MAGYIGKSQSVVITQEEDTLDTVTGRGATTDVAVTLSNGLTVDKDGATVTTFDRATSNGTIVDLQKDGTAVGSIGTYDTDIHIGSGDVGLSFYEAGQTVLPFNPSTPVYRDNAIGLGNSSNRFTDLYLSGGVYLGGTGAANYLDDYEEGLWTPEFASDSGTDPTCTYDNIQFGYYQRVGDWVHCTGGLRTDSVSGGTLNLAIKGLPFAGESTTISGTTCRQAGTIGQAYAWSGNAPSGIYVFEGQTKLYLFKNSSTSALSDQAQVLTSNLVNASNSNGIQFSITYKIN